MMLLSTYTDSTDSDVSAFVTGPSQRTQARCHGSVSRAEQVVLARSGRYLSGD